MSFRLYLLYVFMTFFRPVEMWAPDMAAYRPMLTLSVLCLGLSLLNIRKEHAVSARKIHYQLFFGFCFIMMMSQVANGYGIGGAMQAFNEFSPSIMLFTLTTLNVNSVDRVRKTSIATIIGLLFAAYYSIHAYHTGDRADELVMRQKAPEHDLDDIALAPPVDAPADYEYDWFVFRIRSLAILSDPNDFAQAMVMTLPMIVGLYRHGAHLRNLVVLGLPISVFLYAISLTQSRGARLGIAAALGVGAIKVLGWRRTLIGGAIIAVLFTAGSISSGGGRTISAKDKSSEDRILSWAAGVEMLKSRPVFGVGYGHFTEHNEANMSLTAHNSFVLCFSELGVSGYLIWLGLITLAIKGANRGAAIVEKNSPAYFMSMMMTTGITGFFVCAWFLSRTYQPTLYFMLGLCVASWHICWHNRTEEHRNEEEPKILWGRTSLIAAALLFTIVNGFILYQEMGGGGEE
jgi:hypothetical protein